MYLKQGCYSISSTYAILSQYQLFLLAKVTFLTLVLNRDLRPLYLNNANNSSHLSKSMLCAGLQINVFRGSRGTACPISFDWWGEVEEKRPLGNGCLAPSVVWGGRWSPGSGGDDISPQQQPARYVQSPMPNPTLPTRSDQT